MYNRRAMLLGPCKTSMRVDIYQELKPDEYPSWDVSSEQGKKEDAERVKLMAQPGPFQETYGYAYEIRPIGFIYPDFEFISFPLKKSWFGDGKYKKHKFFVPSSGYTYVHAYNPDNKKQHYRSVFPDQAERIIRENNPKDLIKWKRYEWLRKLEQSKFYWLVGNGRGSPVINLYSKGYAKSPKIGDFELFIFSDVLGMAGCLILWISWAAKDLRLWFYYLFWVFAYWFGRVGFWSPNLAFKKVGWLAMFYNCFDWLMVEGRLFLLLALVISVPLILRIGFVYLTRHLIPRIKRGAEDLMKVDKDKEKRKDIAGDTCEKLA